MMTVDLIVLGVVLLSALLALARGLLREVFSLAAWIGASIAAYALFKDVAPIARAHISSPSLADGITVLGVFAVSLLALLLVGHLIASLVLRGKAISAIDRTLGLIFGAARGALIMTLVYLGTTWIWPPAPEEAKLSLPGLKQDSEALRETPPANMQSIGSRQPEWLAKAHTRPYLAAGSALLVEWMPALAPPKPTARNDANAEQPNASGKPPFSLQVPVTVTLTPDQKPHESSAPEAEQPHHPGPAAAPQPGR